MLYLHIPYCHRKCSYCAFYSVVSSDGRAEYVDALCKEIRLRGDGRALKTIYFGGGTPSMLSIAELSKIRDAIGKSFDISHVEEVTIEANPEDLTKDYLVELYDMKFFNRLSIGVQSFNDSDLRVINRRHNSMQATRAILEASEVGFLNLSIDIIMGLPSQKVADFEENLCRMEKLLSQSAIKHISCYELTVEENTILDKQLKMGRLTLPDEDVLVSEYEALQKWCQEKGFEQYEVSNFALPGWHSRHNSRYWKQVPYIGVGTGAHSFDGNRRRWNLSDIKEYIEGVKRGEVPYAEEQLTKDDMFNEFVMTALRTAKGINKRSLQELYPDNAALVSAKMEKYKHHGLIKETEDSYEPTSKGLLQADAMAAEMFKIEN